MTSKDNEAQPSYENLAYSPEDGGGGGGGGGGPAASGRARHRSRGRDTPSIGVAKELEPIGRDVSTPDKLLTLYGSTNVYLVFVWLVMAGVWALTAMPMMVSAFLMSPSCSTTVGSTLQSNGSDHKGGCPTASGTMAAEFHLFGSRAKLGDYTTSAILIGDTVGSIFLPPISDRWGRRPILLLSMALYGSFGVLGSLSPDIYSFIFLRFLQGIFFTGAGVTSWVLAYESIPIRLRSFTTMSFGLNWVAGYCIVAPLAIYISDWRWLVVAVSAPSLLGAILYYFTIPESFHFVVSHSRSADVAIWIDRANHFASWTGGARASPASAGELSADLKSCKSDAESNNGTSNPSLIRQFFSNRVLLLNLGVMVYLWTCDAFVYYGLSLFSTQLAGDRYLNFVLLGLIEIPSYIISPILLDKLGRRKFMCFVHLLAAGSFFVVAISHSAQLKLLMWLVGKFAIASAFTSLFVYSSELFPTVVRNVCLGVCSVVARLGGSLAPAVQIMVTVSPVMPTVFFGCCALIGVFLTLLLTETLNRELPDSTDEIN